MSDYLDEVKPHVKPSRDELLRAIGDALADSWSDVEEYAEAPEAIADAVLALFNGKTEQELRDEIAEEIAEVTRTIRNAQLDAHGFIPDTVGHMLAGYAQAEGVARGGEQNG